MTETTQQSPATPAPHRGELLIGGELRAAASGERFRRENPARVSEVVGDYADAGEADVDAAIAAARTAFDEGPWPRLHGVERAATLRRCAGGLRSSRDALALLVAREAGKPVREAEGEVDLLAACFDYAADSVSHIRGETITNMDPDGVGLVLHEPVGVVAAITPFNFPLLTLAAKLPYALAAGCTLVVKASPLTPGPALEVARLLQEGGVPPGTVNVVSSSQGAAGRWLVESEGVDKVAFTGSNATGQAIMRGAAGTMKRLTLELGGKNPNVVFADADLDLFAESFFASIFLNAGQVCGAGSRLLVHEDVHAELLERIVAVARDARVGDPVDPATTMGPLASAAQLERVQGYVAGAREAGLEPLTGGGRLDGDGLGEGYFFAPTILDAVRPDLPVAVEEVFGPVLCVIPFRDEAEAIATANASRYGLKAAVWTSSLDRLFRLARGIKAGTIMANTFSGYVHMPSMPYGGFKESGLGREFGRGGVIENYMETKSIHLRIGSV